MLYNEFITANNIENEEGIKALIGALKINKLFTAIDLGNTIEHIFLSLLL